MEETQSMGGWRRIVSVAGVVGGGGGEQVKEKGNKRVGRREET